MLLRRIAITPRAVIGFAILASLLVALGSSRTTAWVR